LAPEEPHLYALRGQAQNLQAEGALHPPGTAQGPV
jgi:hypothetical protein